MGVVRRVILAAEPGLQVIDLTHRIRPHDVRAGALTLWRNAPWLRDSVVLAVVDPGVGTERRPVAIDVSEAGTVLVGPDNGLLLPAAHALGGPSAAVRITPLPGVHGGLGATFDGRDLFAPVAARIACGESTVDQAGEPIDLGGLAGEPVPGPVVDDVGRLRCEVLWIDRFGNVQLNARPPDIAHLRTRPAVTLPGAGTSLRARAVKAFGELGEGELGLVTDSYGLLALAYNRSSAAERLAVAEGDPVSIGDSGDE